MTTGKEAAHWQGVTRRLARQVNAAWWLDHWLPWCLGAGIVGSVLLLWVRWQAGARAEQWVWAGLGVWALLSAAVAGWFAKRRFENTDAARVRLEDSLRMKAALSAAHAGIIPWPAADELPHWPLRVQWTRPVAVALFTIAMLALAAWVPIPDTLKPRERTIEKPAALADVQTWMDQLRENEAVQEESAQQVEEKVQELLQRPAENWYEHGTLEAADHLKAQTMDMLGDLTRNLTEAERAAAALDAAGAALPKAARDALTENLASAIEGMQGGGLKPNDELLKQMQGMSPEQLAGSLSPEQMKQLAQTLNQNRKALEEALKNSPGLDWEEMTSRKPGNGPGNASGPDGSNEGTGPGRGGISRGPGEADLTLKQDPTELGTSKTEKLPSQIDMQRLAPGDLITTTDGKHETDKTYSGPLSSGAAANPADGGAAVWQNSLVPAERATLRRYFKEPASPPQP